MAKVKKARSYSISADETAEISGKEHFDANCYRIKEDFVSFVELEGPNGKSFANAIDQFVSK